MAITFRGRSRRIGSERSGNFGFIILLMDGLGNYQKNIPAQEKATKKCYKADHAKDPYEKNRKQLLHDVTLKKEILAQKIARPGLKNIYWSIP